MNIATPMRSLAEWFERKLPIFIMLGLITLLLILYFWSKIFITIHSGEAGILYRRFFGGTIVDYIYPEGMQIIPPWDTMYVYNIRIQTLLHEFEVLSSGGLHITLKLAIRYRPEREVLGILHKEVGPDYVNKIIVPEIESVIREEISKLTPDQIYQFKLGMGSWVSEVVIKALEQAGQKFVKIDDIIIRNIVLPDMIRQAIENKLAEEQAFEAYKFKLLKETQERKRKRIEAEGIRNYQEIISQTLNEQLIKWQGVQATLEVAKSDNSKIIIIGAGKEGLPVILGTDR